MKLKLVEYYIRYVYRVASNMVTQFNTDEPLISIETKGILKTTEGRNELYKKIIQKSKRGWVTISANGKDHKFFVEA